MRVGPLIVGAVIGGTVWVLALRAASAASRGDDAPGVPPHVDPPDMADADHVTDADATNEELAQAAAGSIPTVSTIVAGDNLAAGSNGQAGCATEVRTDPQTHTAIVDDCASGGQGVDQMGSSPARGPSADTPMFQRAEPSYDAYIAAVFGGAGTDGLTDSQIAAALQQAARVGGLGS